jgi:hypothetical protein
MKIKQAVAWILLLVLAVSIMGCSGGSDNKASANKGEAQVRFAGMFFPLSDVSLDDKLVQDDLHYPFISDYQPVSAGKHAVRVASSSDESAAAQIDLQLVEGHHYLVVSYGNLSKMSDHQLMVVDETDYRAQINPDENLVLFLHLVVGAPGVDGYVGDQRVLENATFAQPVLYHMPAGIISVKMTPANMPALVMFEEDDLNSLPNTYTVVAVLGSLLDPMIVYDIYTPMPLLDLFGYVAAAGYYESWQQMLKQSGMDQTLAGPGPYTLFAPWDSSFMNVPLDEILADPERLQAVMRYHVVPERISAAALFQRNELTTLQGGTLAVTWTTDKPYFRLNGGATVYQHYHASNGEFYELNTVLIPPTP